MNSHTGSFPNSAAENSVARAVRRLAAIAHRSPTFAVGFAIISAYAAVALFAPLLAPYDPTFAFPTQPLRAPSFAHPFGTDGNGMDVLSRTIHGVRYGFGVALPTVALSLAVGAPLGLIAGYFGGLVDEAMMRAFDALRVFPSIILALTVVAATGPSLLNVVLVVGLLDSPIFARLVRSEVLALRQGGFVEAAVAAGNPRRRVMFVHLLPNAIQGATAQAAVRAAWAVRISATLSFIGVGIQPPTPEWGSMIRQGAEYMVTGQWWVGVFPGAALILLVLGFNLLGDGLQDLLDPNRNRGQR
jgi:peptide/nickel transport system permease protein